MFELALGHLNQADREREIEAALRRRLLLDAQAERPATRSTVRTEAPAPAAARLRPAGR